MDPELLHPDSAWTPAVRAVVTIGDQIAAMRPIEALPDAARHAAQHDADMVAHHGLRTALADAYPGIPVISEEDAEHDDQRPARYWLIDPIDGTASWSGGFPGFVCQVACIEHEQVVFSAIHAPVLQRTWTCSDGGGAYDNGHRLPPRHAPVADADLVVIDNYPQPRGVAADLMSWLGTARYRESGSIGLKAALVASGEADVFVKDVVVRDWDLAPAIALIRQVGADVRRGDGQPYRLHGPLAKPEGVLVTATAELSARISPWLGKRQPR